MYPPVYQIKNACEVEVEDDEEKLKKLIGLVGPVAAVIQVTEGLYSYSDGVFYDPNCDSNAFDHAVVWNHSVSVYVLHFFLSRQSSATAKTENTATFGSLEILGVKVGEDEVMDISPETETTLLVDWQNMRCTFVEK